MTQIHRIQFMGKLIRHASILAIMTLIFMAGTFWAYAHELDKVLNLLQASAILLALFLLSLLALKDEGLRYKTDPDSFGYQRYKNLLKSSRASHKDQASYDVFDHEGLVSRSLLEDWPLQKSLIASGSTILDVEFRVDTTQRYELPWFLQSDGTALLRERFNTLSGNDFNGSTLSVDDLAFQPSGQGRGRIRYAMRFGNYFEYLLTNVIPEASVSGVDIRSWLEPEKNESLNPLRFAQAENHLGLSCTITTADGYVLVGHRRAQNTVFKGEWSPTISGAANLDTCANPEASALINGSGDQDGITSSAYTGIDFFIREARDEILQLMPGLFGTSPQEVREQLQQLRFVGATRELIRLGKPEIFFTMQLGQTLEEIKAMQGMPSSHSVGDVHYFHGSEKTENIGFMAIQAHQIFEQLTFDQRAKRPERRNPYLKGESDWVLWLKDWLVYAVLHGARRLLTRNARSHQWRPVLKLPDHPPRKGKSIHLVLSESCVVNLLLMRRAQQMQQQD